jgi:hypothetical protein
MWAAVQMNFQRFLYFLSNDEKNSLNGTTASSRLSQLYF